MYHFIGKSSRKKYGNLFSNLIFKNVKSISPNPGHHHFLQKPKNITRFCSIGFLKAILILYLHNLNASHAHQVLYYLIKQVVNFESNQHCYCLILFSCIFIHLSLEEDLGFFRWTVCLHPLMRVPVPRFRLFLEILSTLICCLFGFHQAGISYKHVSTLLLNSVCIGSMSY